MRSLPVVLTVLFLIPAPAGSLSAGEGPSMAADPYLTDWQIGGRNMILTDEP